MANEDNLDQLMDELNEQLREDRVTQARYISPKPMNRYNRKRSLSRIQKELISIAEKTDPKSPDIADIREAIRHVVLAILAL